MNQDGTNIDETAFLGIDIGSKTSKAILIKAKLTDTHDFKYEVLNASIVSSNDTVSRSKIVNLDQATEIFDKLIEEVTQNYSGAVYTSLAIQDDSLKGQVHRASNLFSKHQRVVEKKDADDVMKMVSNTRIEQEKEYIHVMPRTFFVDKQVADDNPVGLSGSSIDVEALLISINKQSLSHVTHCTNSIGYPCNFLCASPLATGESILTKKEKSEGVILIDFGAGITTASIFAKNKMQDIAVLPLGGIDISSDIGQVLGIPLSSAELIKCKYGVADREYLSMYSQVVQVIFNQYVMDIAMEDIYKIVYARAHEILSLIKKMLQQNNDISAYQVVMTGAGSQLQGLTQLVREVFGNSVRIAQPWNWGGPFTTYGNPSFSTAIGVCIAGLNHHLIHGWTSFVEENKKIKSKPRSHFGHVFKDAYTSLSDKFRNFLSLGDID